MVTRERRDSSMRARVQHGSDTRDRAPLSAVVAACAHAATLAGEREEGGARLRHVAIDGSDPERVL